MAQEKTQRSEQSTYHIEEIPHVAICSWSSSQGEVGHWCLEAPSYLERRRVQELDQKSGLHHGLAMLEMSYQSCYPKGNLSEVQGALEQGLEEKPIATSVAEQQEQGRGQARRGQRSGHGVGSFCKQSAVGGHHTTHQNGSGSRVSAESRGAGYWRAEGGGCLGGAAIHDASIGEAGQSNADAFEEPQEHDGQPSRGVRAEVAGIGSCSAQVEPWPSESDEQGPEANSDHTRETSKARCRMEFLRGTGGGKIPKAQGSLPRDEGATDANQEAENCRVRANQGGYCSSLSFPHEYSGRPGNGRLRSQRCGAAGVVAVSCGTNGDGGGWLHGPGHPCGGDWRLPTNATCSTQTICQASAGRITRQSGQGTSQGKDQDMMCCYGTEEDLVEVPWVSVDCLVDNVFQGSWQWDHQIELQTSAGERMSTRTETSFTQIPATQFDHMEPQQEAAATRSKVAFNPVVDIIYFDAVESQEGVAALDVGMAMCSSHEHHASTVLRTCKPRMPGCSDVCLDPVAWYDSIPGVNFLTGYTEDNLDLRSDQSDQICDSYTEDNSDLRSGWVNFLNGYTEDNLDLRSDHAAPVDDSCTEDPLVLRSGCVKHVEDSWLFSSSHSWTEVDDIARAVDDVIGKSDAVCPWALGLLSSGKNAPCLDDRWCADFQMLDVVRRHFQSPDHELQSVVDQQCIASQLNWGRDVSFEVDNDESIQIGMHGHYTKGNVDLRYGVSCHFDEPIVMRANDVILDADVIRDAKSWHYTEVNSGLRSGVQPLHESASLAQDEADVLLQVDANMDVSTRYMVLHAVICLVSSRHSKLYWILPDRVLLELMMMQLQAGQVS